MTSKLVASFQSHGFALTRLARRAYREVLVGAIEHPSAIGSDAEQLVGADVVKKVVKTGDIIIIPAGVPHGWSDIGDHVDYLSFRPSGHELMAGYVHPSIKKP